MKGAQKLANQPFLLRFKTLTLLYWSMGLAALFLASCSGGPNESSPSPAYTPPTSSPAQSSELTPFDDLTNEPEVRKPGKSFFPFGCETLVQFQFANNWRILDRAGTQDMGHSIYHKAILEINSCLSNINHAGTHSLNLTLKDVKPVRLSHDAITCNDALATDSIIYTLPNLGPYKAYYAFSNFDADKPQEQEPTLEDCLEYGNLVLVDSTTSRAQVLNLYLAKGTHNSMQLRLFFIDENQVIHLKELTCDDTFCNISGEYRVVIDDQGKINIQTL